jgi:hypothetical protein
MHHYAAQVKVEKTTAYKLMLFDKLPESVTDLHEKLKIDRMYQYINPNTNQMVHVHENGWGLDRYDAGFWIDSDFYPAKSGLSLAQALDYFIEMANGEKFYQLSDINSL